MKFEKYELFLYSAIQKMQREHETKWVRLEKPEDVFKILGWEYSKVDLKGILEAKKTLSTPQPMLHRQKVVDTRGNTRTYSYNDHATILFFNAEIGEKESPEYYKALKNHESQEELNRLDEKHFIGLYSTVGEDWWKQLTTN